MTARDDSTLAARCLAIRHQLRAQREVIAEQLAPVAGAQNRFPRSLTMRLLIHRPDLLSRLVAPIVGTRLAGSASKIFSVLHLLRSASGIGRRPRNSPPVSDQPFLK